jgi:hypothetical protein
MSASPSPPGSIHSIKASIQEELASVFDGCAALPDRDEWRLEGPIYHRNHSQIFLLHHARETAPLIVKWYCHESDMSAAPEEAVHQYQVMKKIHRELGDYGLFRCPKPVLLLEKAAAVVMEQASGTNLRQLLARWTCSARYKADAIMLVGAWLRIFHRCYAGPSAPLDFKRKWEDIQNCLKQASSKTRNAAFLQEALHELERFPKDPISLPTTLAHGDFKPENVHFDANRVTVLDVGMQYTDSVLLDMSQFIVGLRLSTLWPRAIVHTPWIARWESAFIRGYTQDASRYHFPLEWLNLQMLARQWLARSGRSDRDPTEIYIRWRLKRLIEKSLRRMRTLRAESQFHGSSAWASLESAGGTQGSEHDTTARHHKSS